MDHQRPNALLYLLAGALFAVALAVGGYSFYQREARAIREEKYSDLKAIADLKTGQLVAWIGERLSDAQLGAKGAIETDVRQWLETPGDAALRSQILARLQLFADLYRYRNVIVAGADGRLLFTLDPRLTELEENARRLVAQADTATTAVLGDFFRCSHCSEVHLDVAAPIMGADGRPAAALILRSDPEQYLYPLIQSWPTPSRSAETLLVRKDDGAVLFLNALRHQPDPALSLRIPFSRTDLPAVRAVLGDTGEFEGRDYVGSEVLADLRAIPGTPWFMVAKVRTDEILAEVRFRGRIILLFVCLAVAMAAAVGAFQFSRRQQGLYESLYRAERARREAQEEIRATFYGIGDGVISTDAEGRVRRMNPVAERLTGWSEAEAAGQPLDQVFCIVNEETRATVENPVWRVIREGNIVGLANHTLLVARDGTERPIADSGSPVRDDLGAIAGVALVFRDQSAERATQRALQAERDNLEALMSASPVGLLVFDGEGRVARANPAAQRLFGRSAAELEQTSCGEFLGCVNRHGDPRGCGHSPECAACPLLAAVNAALSDGQATHEREMESLLERGGASERCWLQFSVEPVALDGRRHAVVALHDITIRRRTAEELRELSARNAALLDSVPDIIMEVDSNKVYTWCNRAGRDFFGDDVIGREAQHYFLGEQETYRHVQPIFNGNENVVYLESWQRRKDGEKRLLAWWCRSLKDADGVVRGALSTARDITEQSKAEEALVRERLLLRTLVDNLPDAIYIKDLETRKVVSNRADLDNMGAADEAAVLGKTDAELFPPEIADQFYADDQSVLQRGEPILGREEMLVRPDGETRWLLTSKLPLRDHAGQIVGLIGIGRDITERKRLEDQLRQALKMEAVGRLAGGVAHDFNNMLQAILGYTDLALDQVAPDAPLRQDLEQIRSAAQRSAALTRQLLAFARKQTVMPRVLDLNDTVSGILNMLRRLIGEDIELMWKPAANLWPVLIDPAQVDQMLANLTTNARDAIAGVGRLTVETGNVVFDAEYCEAHVGFVPGEFAMLAVSDTGAGMDKATLEHLFEPFFTTKGLGKGTGLGLASVYGIVKQNNGFINVYSEPGQGTTFKIYLPRTRQVEEAPVAGLAEPAPVGGDETVLLVEDEETILNLGKAILERHGYTVLAERTPGAALALARRHEGPIHLLITDVVMPEMNGNQLCQALRAFRPGVKALFMSGYTANAIAHHGVIDKGVRFLQKPFSSSALAGKAREALDAPAG